MVARDETGKPNRLANIYAKAPSAAVEIAALENLSLRRGRWCGKPAILSTKCSFFKRFMI